MCILFKLYKNITFLHNSSSFCKKNDNICLHLIEKKKKQQQQQSKRKNTWTYSHTHRLCYASTKMCLKLSFLSHDEMPGNATAPVMVDNRWPKMKAHMHFIHVLRLPAPTDIIASTQSRTIVIAQKMQLPVFSHCMWICRGERCNVSTWTRSNVRIFEESACRQKNGSITSINLVFFGTYFHCIDTLHLDSISSATKVRWAFQKIATVHSDCSSIENNKILCKCLTIELI